MGLRNPLASAVHPLMFTEPSLVAPTADLDCSTPPNCGWGFPFPSPTFTTYCDNSLPRAGGKARPLLLWHALQEEFTKCGPDFPFNSGKESFIGSSCKPVTKSEWKT